MFYRTYQKPPEAWDVRLHAPLEKVLSFLDFERIVSCSQKFHIVPFP
ncbi:hypothetical protein [Chlamydia crocodili]